jgi:hypothetical protein
MSLDRYPAAVHGFLDWMSRNVDNIILTAVSLVLGGLFSWLLFVRQKQPKTLDYYLVSDQLISSKANPNKIKVNWTGAMPGKPRNELIEYELSDPRISRIHIRNTGKREIERDDFAQPITVTVRDGIILDVEVTGASHPAVYPFGTVDDPAAEVKKWTFAPTLLNPNDWVELTVLTDKASTHPRVSSWIKGQSRPMGIWDPRRAPLYKVIIARLGSTRGRKVLAAVSIVLGAVLFIAVVVRLAIVIQALLDYYGPRILPPTPRPTVTPR